MIHFKATTIILLIFLTRTAAFCGTSELFEIHSLKFGVRITEDEKNIVLTFNNEMRCHQHSIIDIRRINNLQYKTRLMRYFGGLLKTKTYHFEKLIIVDNNRTLELDFNRENVSLVINQICSFAEKLHMQKEPISDDRFKHQYQL